MYESGLKALRTKSEFHLSIYIFNVLDDDIFYLHVCLYV